MADTRARLGYRLDEEDEQLSRMAEARVPEVVAPSNLIPVGPGGKAPGTASPFAARQSTTGVAPTAFAGDPTRPTPRAETMQGEPELPDGTRPGSGLGDIIAIIESAKARGGRAGLVRHIAKVLPESDADQVEEVADVALEVIESIPVFLARARQEADTRGLASVAGPLLERAERYYLQPLDLMPEMTQGLVGLLDDTYLVIRTLQKLDEGPQPFLDWDLDDPARFLQRLIGAPVAQRLDGIALQSLEEVSEHLAEMWRLMSHPA